MDLPNAIERRRNLLRRQHKAIATEGSYERADSVEIAPGWKEPISSSRGRQKRRHCTSRMKKCISTIAQYCTVTFNAE